MTAWAAEAVRQNLAWIIGGAAILYAGYTSGLTKIGDLDARQARDERRYDKSRAFMNCLIRHVDKIESGVAGPAPCVLEVPE